MKINTRQVCFILFAYTAASRLLMYPSVLSAACRRDLLFPALINFVISTLVILSLAILSSRTDKTFYELLRDSIGKVGARIVFGFFAVYFLLAAFMPIFEHEQYIHAIFYDTTSTRVVFLPFFIFTAYAACKSFTNIGRCADICAPIFAVCMTLIFLMGVGEAKFVTLLPMLKEPPAGIIKGVGDTALWFTEPCWLLMFMGHFKYRKGDAAKITLSYAGGAITVLFFLAIFQGIYGGIASSRTFAIARTSLFFSAIESIGRIDLLVLFVLEVVLLFSLVLNIQLGVHSAAKCIGTDKLAVVSLVINALFALIVLIFDKFYGAIYELFTGWFWIPSIVFVLAIPLLAWTLKRRKNEKKAE